MAKKNNSKRGIVYSTNPDFEYSQEDETGEKTLPGKKQNLRIQLVRLKGNKKVTKVYNYIGKEDDLKDLGKALKSKCGCGGAVKDGEILLQGDFREKVKAELDKLGYSYKQVGG
jgi:translation initiation factor 1